MNAGSATQAGERPIDHWFAHYSGDHVNPVNQRIHVVAVPLILWSVVGLLWCIPVPGTTFRPGLWAALAACALLWPAAGLFLKAYTDTDVPWWDAFPTAVSLVGQFLLGRKYIENWAAWLVVNTVSVALFVHKGLWLTAVLYGVFVVLSVAGWLAWQRRLR